MSLLKTEGVILQALKFKDYDQILTVFCPAHGIQKFIYKGGLSSRRKKGSSSTPPTRGEFVYNSRNSELSVCREISVLSHFLGIRKNLETLEASCDMIKAVHQTQQPGKPAPRLYQLLVAFLEHLPSIPFPQTLASCFLLKLLLHDGHLSPLTHCSACQDPLTALFIEGGEGFCREHAQGNFIFFDERERALILKLLHTRSLSEISSMAIPNSAREKIQITFNMIISH